MIKEKKFSKPWADIIEFLDGDAVLTDNVISSYPEPGDPDDVDNPGTGDIH